MFFYSNTNSQGQTEVLCKCKVAGLVDGLRMPLYGCYLNFYGNYRAKKTRVLRRAFSVSRPVWGFPNPASRPACPERWHGEWSPLGLHQLGRAVSRVRVG